LYFVDYLSIKRINIDVHISLHEGTGNVRVRRRRIPRLPDEVVGKSSVLLLRRGKFSCASTPGKFVIVICTGALSLNRKEITCCFKLNEESSMAEREELVREWGRGEGRVVLR